MIWNFILWLGSLLHLKFRVVDFFAVSYRVSKIIIFIVLHFSEYRANQEKAKERERRRALIKEVRMVIRGVFGWYIVDVFWVLCIRTMVFE